MNKKELLEKKELISNELQSMLDNVSNETRSFSEEEDSTYKAKETELKSIVEELRALEDGEKIEVEGDNKDMKIEERQLTEAYIKGIASGNFEEFRTLSATVTGSGLVAHNNTIPQNLQEEIIKKVFEMSDVANECGRVSAKGDVTFFVEGADVFAKMLAENEELTEDDISQFSTVTLKDKRIGTLVTVTKNLLLNSPVVSEAYIVDKIATRIARLLERQVLKADGSGSNMSKGILVNPAAGNKVLGAVTGVITVDELQEMVTSLKPQFLNGAKFYMNRNTFVKVSKLKDGVNHYFLTYDVAGNKPGYKLFGFDVIITDEMPEIGVGATPILLANLGEAMKVKIGQESQIQVLREKYATRGAVGLMAEFYGDCAVVNTEAFKVYVAK